MNEAKRPNHPPSTSIPSGGASAVTWTSREAYLLAAVCLLFGIVLGYLFRGSSGVPVTSATAVSPAVQGQAAPGAPMPAAAPGPVTAEALEPLAAPLLAAVRTDPKNTEALIELGNLYFDHKLYPQAIEYYTRALEQQPNNPNVRTDLGTAYYYSGNPARAVEEYEKSLKVDPNHVNSMLNMGIVKLNGLNDARGAIAAWERLLKQNPNYADKQRVLDLIAQAKGKTR